MTEQLSEEHRDVLRALNRLGAHDSRSARPVAMVAREAGRSASVMAYLLRRMRKQGLAERFAPDPQARVWAWWLTAEGLAEAREPG